MAESIYFKRFRLSSKQMMLQIREPIAMFSLTYVYATLLLSAAQVAEALPVTACTPLPCIARGTRYSMVHKKSGRIQKKANHILRA
jgi:hypothetical protein